MMDVEIIVKDFASRLQT